MEQGFDLRLVASEIWSKLATSLGNLVPKLAIALVLLLLGLGFAKLIAYLVRSVLVKVRFDSVAERIGVKRVLTRIGWSQPPSHAVGSLSFWIVLILILQSALDILGLEAVAVAMGRIVAYVPNVVAAVIILLLGVVLGRVAGRIVGEAASSTGATFASMLGNAVRWLIFIVLTMMALAQLNIDTQVIQVIAVVLLSGFSLAVAFAFGFGARDIARSIIAGFYSRKLYSPGDTFDHRGETVRLRAITPIQTILEGKDRLIPVSNWEFIKRRP